MNTDKKFLFRWLMWFFGLAMLGTVAAIEADIVANLDTYKRFSAAPAETTPPQVMQQLEKVLERVRLTCTHSRKPERGDILKSTNY